MISGPPSTTGRREEALNAVVTELRSLGIRAEVLTVDLNDLAQAEGLIERAERALGPVDVLVNNAGVEYCSAFDQAPRNELLETVSVNLTAPMLLTHAALPGMLDRGRGHVVFMASAAGKIGPAFEAPYGATKAGLIALTQGLRQEFRKRPVSFSVVTPGFVAGDGMYQRMVEDGVRSNRLIGSTTIERIANDVLNAIRRDLPEVVDTGAPVRPVLALSQLAPRTTERLVARIGLDKMFERTAELRGRADR
ncbi:MAG: SDR family NAD(P)-dependent oxidoreductase [Actinobacteria bacterium]|nr:MAG: SDR family NAD(P)-dependent oxidoreductase [Actinomycetota bacterium]